MCTNKKMIKSGKYNVDIAEKTVIMGILNVTPDSFSDGGKYNSIENAVTRAIEMVKEGAKIIDIGGESTRPGFKKVSEEEELRRVIPIIKAVSNVVDVPISIDTYKSEVARQALEAGASIINDVWGAKADPRIAEVAAEYQVPIILMHNRLDPTYENLQVDLINDLEDSISICQKAGVEDGQIILDPGIGFAKTYEENVEVMRSLDHIVQLGYPVLLGTSRKSMIGITLNLPSHERVEGTLATVCYGIMKGCQIMRVHDVLQASRAAEMMDTLIYKGVDLNG